MINFYKKEIAIVKEQIRLAEIGLDDYVKSVGLSLIRATTLTESKLILDKLVSSKNAVVLLEKNLSILNDKLMAEIEKRKRKQEVEKILFGGKNER